MPLWRGSPLAWRIRPRKKSRTSRLSQSGSRSRRDILICLEDGKRFKSLKRHLAAHGLTPERYRAKWKLPSDYPMVAANYAASRSAMAKAIGLGQLGGNAGAHIRGR